MRVQRLLQRLPSYHPGLGIRARGAGRASDDRKADKANVAEPADAKVQPKCLPDLDAVAEGKVGDQAGLHCARVWRLISLHDVAWPALIVSTEALKSGEPGMSTALLLQTSNGVLACMTSFARAMIVQALK